MTPFRFHQFLYGSDNYGVLMHDPASGQTAAIDAGDGPAYQAAIAETGWRISHILLTHHHWDHTDGVAELASMTGATIYGPSGDKDGHAHITQTLAEGDRLNFGGTDIEVIATPGHTLDMLNYYLPEQGVCFTGDTLFSLGCGRIFEGDPSMMWDSLTKLMALPAETTLYSSHEYTQANAAFALSVDPDNAELIARCAGVEEKRAKGQPTVPSLLSEELATNPFLRASDARIRAQLKMPDASDREVFAEIRSRKDNF
jgi:hydroxyacylglutathione hydrolase